MNIIDDPYYTLDHKSNIHKNKQKPFALMNRSRTGKDQERLSYQVTFCSVPALEVWESDLVTQSFPVFSSPGSVATATSLVSSSLVVSPQQPTYVVQWL
jgi:hypothetical protein